MKTAILTSVLMLIALSASADELVDQKCVDACNIKYTPEYLKCGQVVECQAYVKSEAGICIRHCQ